MSVKMVWICPKCGAISSHETDAVCEQCKIPLVCTQISSEEFLGYKGHQFDELVEEMKQKYVIGYEKKAEEKSSRGDLSQYVPKCPTCGCPYIRETTHLEAAYNPAGHHSKTAFKSFVCLNCGYAW